MSISYRCNQIAAYAAVALLFLLGSSAPALAGSGVKTNAPTGISTVPVRSGNAIIQPGNKSITTLSTVVGQKLTGEVTIDYPTDGQHFTTSDIIVSGRCPAGSIVTVYDNDAIRGSARCLEVNKHGEYSIPIRLFAGKNVLRARAVNELGVGDLESNIVTVYFDVPSGCGSGQYFLLPVEGVVNAAPGAEVLRHVVIIGGTQPYVLTWDWGDGNVSTSVAPAQGQTELSHVYKSIGIYTVGVKAVDKNGAVATTQIITAVLNSGNTDLPGRLLSYWPLALLILLLLSTYLLGHRRGRLYERRLEEDERRWTEHDNENHGSHNGGAGGQGSQGGHDTSQGAVLPGHVTHPEHISHINQSPNTPRPNHIIHPDGSFQL
jgi:hypothetical protein